MSAAEKLELHSLASLRSEIRRIHTLAESDAKAHARLYIERCADIGRLLSLAKKQCGHGEWTPWVAANLPFGARQVQKYLKVYRDKSKLIAKAGKTNSAVRLSVNALTGAKLSHSGNGDENYYTPPEFVENVRSLFGAIDTDPASCAAANRVIKAKHFYSEDKNGLTRKWSGAVYVNPPFSKTKFPAFVDKTISEYEAGNASEIVFLAPVWSETKSFQRLMESASAVLFIRGRLNFWNEKSETGRAPFGQAAFYFGSRPAEFSEQFYKLGKIYIA